jgi:hypothetical protein
MQFLNITNQKISEEWKNLEKPGGGNPPGIAWQYYVTPAFPVNWPTLVADARVYYVYAQGPDIGSGLVDGIRVAKPWATIREEPGGKQNFEILAAKLEIAGIQGVRPLSPAEIPKISGNEIYQHDYYKFWRSNNGVIWELLRPLHPAFCEWVEREL